MKGSKIRVCLAFGLAVVGALVSRRAEAQIPEAVYADAKDIIEELLSTEIAHQAAPGIACLSGRRPAKQGEPGVVTYQFGGKTRSVSLEATTHFPKTLQHIYNRQYGTLRSTIRNESASFAGFLVYQALHAAAVAAAPRAAQGDNLATVSAQIRKAANDCPTDRETPETPEPPAPAAQEASPSKGSPAPKEAAEEADHCGTSAERTAGSTLSFVSIDDQEFGVCKKAAGAAFNSGEWGRPASYPLEAACKAQGDETFECELGYAVRAGLLGQPAAVQESLIRATALIVEQLAANPATSPGAREAIQQQVLFLLRQVLTTDGWDPKVLLERGVAVAKGAEGLNLTPLSELGRAEFIELLMTLDHVPTAEEVKPVDGEAAPLAEARKKAAALRKKLFDALALAGGAEVEDVPGTALLARLSTTLKLFGKLEQVHAAWRSAIDADSGRLDVLSFIRTLIAKHGPLAALCEGQSVEACVVVAKLAVISQPGAPSPTPGTVEEVLSEVKPIFAYAGKGEYQEAAQMAVGYLFQRIGDQGDEKIGIHQRFAQAVVTYVLDLADEKVPSEAARVAFRSAAVDMIQHLGEGRGLRRKPTTLLQHVGFPLFPDLALRASWSPSYVTVDDSTVRFIASANMLNFRIPMHRSESSYAGIELSFLDPLAPLGELAMRKNVNTNYREPTNLLMNIVTPRVEAIAGSPGLSEHLVISGGMSLRLCAPTGDPAATEKTGVPSYHYTMVWNAKGKDDEPLWPRFLEFGFAAKYLL